jgi:spore cortex formation protein SpoVR/YcgB (stage V sporulation)
MTSIPLKSQSESTLLQVMEGQDVLLRAIFDAERDLEKVADHLDTLHTVATAIQVTTDDVQEKQIQITKQTARLKSNLQILQQDLKSLEKLHASPEAKKKADDLKATVAKAQEQLQGIIATAVVEKSV